MGKGDLGSSQAQPMLVRLGNMKLRQVWKPESKSQKLLFLALSKGGNRMPENPPNTLLGLLDFEVH